MENFRWTNECCSLVGCFSLVGCNIWGGGGDCSYKLPISMLYFWSKRQPPCYAEMRPWTLCPREAVPIKRKRNRSSKKKGNLYPTEEGRIGGDSKDMLSLKTLASSWSFMNLPLLSGFSKNSMWVRNTHALTICLYKGALPPGNLLSSHYSLCHPCISKNSLTISLRNAKPNPNSRVRPKWTLAASSL